MILFVDSPCFFHLTFVKVDLCKPCLLSIIFCLLAKEFFLMNPSSLENSELILNQRHFLNQKFDELKFLFWSYITIQNQNECSSHWSFLFVRYFVFQLVYLPLRYRSDAISIFNFIQYSTSSDLAIFYKLNFFSEISFFFVFFK